MADDATSVAALRQAVAEFTAARRWEIFHNAKDLAVSVSIEAAELLEEFQWLSPEQVEAAMADDDDRERVRQELADVLIYCLLLANRLDLDVSEAVLDKLVLSGRKYPAERYQTGPQLPGRHRDFSVD